MLKRPRGYDVMSKQTLSDNPAYVNCVTSTLFLFRELGVELPHTRSDITGLAKSNLEALGAIVRMVPSPEGIATRPELSFMGALDNNFHILTLSRDLVGERFHYLLHNRTLSIKEEGDYGFYAWGLNLFINKDPFWRPIMLDMFGFNESNAPDGPPKLMAFLLTVQETIDALIPVLHKKLNSLLANWDFDAGFSWLTLQKHPEVQALLLQEMKTVESWFSPSPTAAR